ncbi:MAG: helix-turn-helix domain-containing protein, partial [Plesiomonas shigelloides]
TWHNNIRELKHVAELYAIGMVDTLSKQADKSVAPVSGDLDEMLNDYERKLLEDALFIFSGKITETANHLGIPRKKLYLKMKKHNLDKNAFKAR